jgi:hypothetical protein
VNDTVITEAEKALDARWENLRYREPNSELTQLDRIERKVDEGFNDVFRAIMAFREIEPEEWAAYLESLERDIDDRDGQST